MTAPKIDTQAPERLWLDVGTFNGAVGFAHSKQHHPGEWKPYVAEDLSAAREAAAAMAMREAAAKEIDCDGCGGKCYDPENCWQSAAADIRALTPPADAAAALDAQVAERVREAEHAGWIRAAKAIKGILAVPQPGTVSEIIDDLIASRIDAARASKEWRDA